MKQRLIDANELHPENYMQSGVALKDAFNMIQDAPTIEAAHVVHAHWIVPKELLYCYDSHVYECSNCGKKSDKLFEFCPHCGAKMDEEAGHEAD